MFSMKRNYLGFSAVVGLTAALSSLLVSCATNPQKAKLQYFQKGQAYMKQGQFSSAAIEFRNALKQDPKYVDAYYQLATADLAQAEKDQFMGKEDLAHSEGQAAYGALTQAISVDPNRVDVRIERAKLLSFARDDKDLAEATSDANYILKEDSKNADAHRVLGSVLFKQKQYDQAIQEFSTAARLAPNDPNAYLGIGMTNLAMHHDNPPDNHLDDAESSFKKAIQVESHAVLAYEGLASVYEQEKKPEQAAQIIQTGIQANPTSLDLYQKLAAFDLQQKQPAQAEQVLQSGITANPKTGPFYMELASLYQREGDATHVEQTLGSLWNQAPKSPDVAIAVGNFYRAAKENDRALAAYQRGLSANPKNLGIEDSIEELYFDEGQTDLAAKLDDDMLKQSPKDVGARIDRGRVLMVQAKVTDAIEQLKKVTEENADSAGGHYWLAIAYEQNRQLDQANNELQQTLRVSPGSTLALTALVNLNFSQKKYSVAQLYAQELVQQTPNDPRAHLFLAQSFLALEQVKQATDEFAAAQKLAPNDAGVQASLASFDAAQSKFAEADKEFQSAMQSAPNNPTIVAQYSAFLISQKQLPKANSLITQFVTQNPNQPAAHLMMGQMDMLEKNAAAALAETQKALQLDSKNVDSYLQLGQIYQVQGNDASAVQAYEQAAGMTPAAAPIIAKIGDLYLQENDLPKASAQFQRALNIDPDLAPAANNLAWIYAEQDQNLDVALNLARKAQAQSPAQPNFSDTLAWVMFRKGDYASALPILRDCIKEDPTDAQFHYHLGMVLVADGQRSEGKHELQTALQMKLDSQDAQQARKALSQ
jgi:tetratricopeptide (TPR) repeat protein